MFEEKTVVVAGAGRGLGREVAQVARREGARVALGARSEKVIGELARDLDPSGESVMAARLDVSDRSSCAEFVAQVAEWGGPVHALVDIAALDYVFGGLADADFDQWHKMLEVNFFGAMYVLSAALPHFPDEGGAVVFVGSQTMFLPPPAVPQAGYAASKSAIIGAMRHLAFELGRRRVRVNNVAPGWMWGPAVETYVKMASDSSGATHEEVKSGITATLPLEEMATDGDVAEAIMFLASDRAHGITGQSLLVNAGEYMH
jgi:NAD(P)-dependent dehydrogenase (short-subunit alcohol dehydrogenase family)